MQLKYFMTSCQEDALRKELFSLPQKAQNGPNAPAAASSLAVQDDLK